MPQQTPGCQEISTAGVAATLAAPFRRRPRIDPHPRLGSIEGKKGRRANPLLLLAGAEDPFLPRQPRLHRWQAGGVPAKRKRLRQTPGCDRVHAMTTPPLSNALSGLTQHEDVRVEKNCDLCAPPDRHAKVRAVSVADATRCDRCSRPLWSGESFWAVFLPLDATDAAAS